MCLADDDDLLEQIWEGPAFSISLYSQFRVQF